ncbi:hypothetical protein ACEWY4_027946 [Coilia grayii]|uniref:Uncharacterized protein n=1 Tax=Coilia grayii TaxID=363190 RepID=A0ABD1INU4_9TELE
MMRCTCSDLDEEDSSQVEEETVASAQETAPVPDVQLEEEGGETTVEGLPRGRPEPESEAVPSSRSTGIPPSVDFLGEVASEALAEQAGRGPDRPRRRAARCPALQDVSMTHRHLHLPGIEEVEALAMVLLELADNNDHILVSADLRQRIASAANSLHDHDKTGARFAKQYESRWGYTLFGRCLGVDSPETRAAQKTKFGWMRYAQAAQVTEDSRLLYLLLKMLKHRAPANQLVSPSKVTASLKGQYKRIADRVRDDPILSGLAIPLPNINAKSISTFISREEKKTNYAATVRPEVTPHLKVLSDMLFPEAPALPSSLPPPDRPQVQYQHVHHEAGKRRGEKRSPFSPLHRPPPPSSNLLLSLPSSRGLLHPLPSSRDLLHPLLSSRGLLMAHPVSAAPILLVLPTQPQAPSVLYHEEPAAVSEGPDEGLAAVSEGPDEEPAAGSEGPDEEPAAGSEGPDEGLAAVSEGPDEAPAAGSEGPDEGLAAVSEGPDEEPAAGSEGPDEGLAAGSEGPDEGLAAGSGWPEPKLTLTDIPVPYRMSRDDTIGTAFAGKALRAFMTWLLL